MRFFSRITFLCNICFIIMVVMRYIELGRKAAGNKDAVIQLPVVQNTIVILGWLAVFLNLFFVISTLYRLLLKRTTLIPRWIVVFNVLVFVWQIAYYFNLY